MTRETIAPIIHLNGTSRLQLIDNLEAVWYAIDKAMDALREAGPNGRDYYPQTGLMDKALEQHRWRGETLEAVKRSITEEMMLIQEQST